MTAPHDPEWSGLMAAWQASRPTLAVDLDQVRRNVAGQRRRVVWILAAEMVITLVTVSVAVEAVRFHPHAFAITWAAASGVLVVVVWGLGLWSGFGVHEPIAEPTAIFLEQSLIRCKRQLRMLRLLLGAILVQLAALAIMALARLREEPTVLGSTSGLLTWGSYAMVGLAYLTWAIWFRRRILQELQPLHRLGEDLRRGP
jgi:hypothetical protein